MLLNASKNPNIFSQVKTKTYNVWHLMKVIRHANRAKKIPNRTKGIKLKIKIKMDSLKLAETDQDVRVTS